MNKNYVIVRAEYLDLGDKKPESYAKFLENKMGEMYTQKEVDAACKKVLKYVFVNDINRVQDDVWAYPEGDKRTTSKLIKEALR